MKRVFASVCIEFEVPDEFDGLNSCVYFPCTPQLRQQRYEGAFGEVIGSVHKSSQTFSVSDKIADTEFVALNC